jgi:hypothetical protein
VIDLSSVSAFVAAGNTLHGYCRKCDRWGQLDLKLAILAGKGDTRIGRIRAWCRMCGGPGEIQVRVPVPPMSKDTWGT